MPPEHQREDQLGKAYDAQMLWRIWGYVRPYQRQFLSVFFLIPLAAGAQLVQPYLLKLAIDEHIAVGTLEGLGALALFFVGALAVQLLASFGQMYLLQALGVQAMNDLRVEVFRHTQRLPQRFFDRVPIGKTMTRMTSDVENIAEMFASGVVTMVADLVLLTGIIGVMLFIDWRLALISFAALPVLAVLVNRFRLKARVAFRETRAIVSHINAYLQENLSGMAVVQAFVREAHNQREFRALNGRYRDAWFDAIRYDALLYSIVEMIGSICVAGVVWYAGGEIVQGALSFGVLVAFVEYIQRFFIPIRDMSAKYTVMQSAMASAERVFGLLDEPTAPIPAEGAAALALEDAITFDQVSFGYRPGDPVLREVSFEVKRGERVALVGATGSGKSTLIRLLTRLYELEEGPEAGQIRVDGEDLRALDVGALRHLFAVVLQDAYLFKGSIAENITLGDASIPLEAVQQAAKKVRLDRVIDRRELGLDAEVGERGAAMSSGERQLVAFARALVRDPEILILDEATASVDSETEALIQDAVEVLLEGRTAIVIAHRLSTIEKVDKVVVLHHGRVVEQGSHSELLALGGFYARLYELQYQAAALSEAS